MSVLSPNKVFHPLVGLQPMHWIITPTWTVLWHGTQIGTGNRELSSILLISLYFAKKKAAKRPKSGLKSFEIFLHLSFTYLVQRSIAFARNAHNCGINTAKRSRFSGVTTMFTVMRTLMRVSIYGVFGSMPSSNEDVGVHCVRSPLFTLQCHGVIQNSLLHCKMYNLESRDCTIQIVHCTQ